jgi:peptide deformylase
MIFEVIASEQTPKVPELNDWRDIELLFVDNLTELEEFLEFAEKQRRAVGLAANQVSIDGERFMLRVFAIRNLVDGSWKIVADPKITEYSGIKELKAEGCLTWQRKLVVAERYRKIHVTYYDTSGVQHEEDLKGFEAEIWQHEVNHLNGIEEQIEDPNFYVMPKEISVGRNEKCPCGSGKKYKQCCLIDE